jgi:hypothetical protein
MVSVSGINPIRQLAGASGAAPRSPSDEMREYLRGKGPAPEPVGAPASQASFVMYDDRGRRVVIERGPMLLLRVDRQEGAAAMEPQRI